MITSLVILLAVIIIGGYIAWQRTQDEYYVAADRGLVVIYRGINERIAGISLSSPYQQTAIPLAQVPSNYQQTVTTAYATGSLSQVEQDVGNIRAAVTLCHQQYTELQNWVSADNAYNRYQAEVAQARHRRPPASIAKLGPPPPKPGPQPPGVGATCPSSQTFGIPASALVPVGSGPS